MIIDLHVHSKDGSDGALGLDELFKEAKARHINLLSISDHDSIECQERAIELARKKELMYLSGVELNVSFPHPSITGKTVALDFLGYGYDVYNNALTKELEKAREHRAWRAKEIMKRINVELRKEGIEELTELDMKKIKESVDGSFGRPHIAKYLVTKDIVQSTREAFNKYLEKCNVPKYPVSLNRASKLIRDAGGFIVLAHGNDPGGTSLVKITKSLEEQMSVVEEHMLGYIDGLECWHSRHDKNTSKHYLEFVRKRGLIATGGSDCHQNPIIMGTVDVPDFVADQLKKWVM